MVKKITQFQNNVNLFLKALSYIIILSLITPCFVFASDTGRITGMICEKSSGDSIPEVTVTLVEKKLTALTDASGRYEFDNIAPGDYTLSITAENYEPTKKKIKVESGKTIVLDFQIEFEVLEVGEIVITGKKKPISVSSKVAVTSSEIKRIPGTGGDALKAIQALPGVSTIGEFSGQLCVRGGGPEDNSFYFDRISLFYPYHFGGFSSTLNNKIIKKVDVYAGGFDAKYGDAQAVIDIFSRDGKKEEFSSKIDINMLMAEGLLEGAFGENSLWYLAGRRSYIDLFPIKADVIVALPRFWDYQTKLTYELGSNHFLNFTAFGSEDFMKLRLKEEDVTNDPDLAGVFHWRSGFHTQGISLKSAISPSISSNFTLSHNYMLWDISMGKGYFIRSEPHVYNLRGDMDFTLSEKYSVETGFNAGFSDFTMEAFFVRPPAEESAGYPSFTDSPKVESDIKDSSVFGNAYAQLKYTPIEPVSLTLGGRGDYYDVLDEFTVSPRASLSLKLSNGADLKFACGEYGQLPQDYQSAPDWGNTALSSIIAYHYVLELERRFSENTLGKITLYYKQLDDLITSAPPEKNYYLNQGEGFVRGIEIFLRRKETERFFGWLSYSYSLSKRKDRPDTPWRFYSYDQTHVLTAVANYKLTSTWEIGGKWRYSTGTPYTPVIDAVEVVDDTGETQRWRAIFGEKNSERLTPYHRLDLRLSKDFKIKSVNFTAYLEIMNVYNHKNMMAVSYNEDYTEKEKAYSLPIIPYFGITASF